MSDELSEEIAALKRRLAELEAKAEPPKPFVPGKPTPVHFVQPVQHAPRFLART